MIKSLNLGAAASFLLLGSHLALAVDGKIYPGANCHDPYNTGNLRAFLGRAYNNSSTSWVTVECPVLKDDIGKSSISSARMYLIDRDPTRSVGCTLYTRSSP